MSPHVVALAATLVALLLQLPLAVAQQDHSQHQRPAVPQAPDQARDPILALTDADRAAAFPAVSGHAAHDRRIVSFVQFNRLEAWDAEDGTGLRWEGQGWVGGDIQKLWLRTEGERVDGTTEAADVEALYGRAIARWWDLVAGIRHDFAPGASQSWAAIGVVGLAPQKFEVEATAYVGDSGRTALRIEAEYDLLLTNRLILQPLVELNLLGKDDPERGVGSGLTAAEVGLRLRYEFARRLAPYAGIVYERAYGGTADLRRDEGEDVEDTRVVAGIRVWF
jgi:copper resistance protein B